MDDAAAVPDMTGKMATAANAAPTKRSESNEVLFCLRRVAVDIINGINQNDIHKRSADDILKITLEIPKRGWTTELMSDLYYHVMEYVTFL